MARDYIPDEERSLSRLFFIFSTILVAASLYVVWDETFARRPWKRFQTEFYTLEYQKLRMAVQAKEQEVEPTLRDLAEKMRQAQAALDANPAYQQTRDELARVKVELGDVSQEQQFAKSRLDAEYYLYKKAEHEEGPEAARKYKAEVDRLERLVASLTAPIGQLDKQRDALEAEMRRAEAPIKDLEEERRKLAADVNRMRERMKEIMVFAIQLPVLGFVSVPKPPEVSQVVIEGLNRSNFGEPLQRVERCQTCHVGIERPGFEAEKNPYRTHPAREILLAHHPVEKFGCTTCHAGQGVALTVATAHGELHLFDQTPRLAESLLTGTWIESQCLKCHQQDIPVLQFASDIARGKELFEKRGCPGCHLVRGFENLEKVAPDLTRLASKVDPAWLVEWIKEPTAYLPQAKMPNFRFTPAESEAAASYLLASSQPFQGPQYPGNGDATAGQKLVGEIGCLGCHMIQGQGNNFAPELTRIASKSHANWLFAWLKNPQGYSATAKMPNLRLSDEQAAHITAYLMTLGDKQESPDLMARLADARRIEEGKQLIGRYGCYGCHEIKGMEERVRVGAELSTFADKRPWEMAFGDVHLVKKKHHDTTPIARLIAFYNDGRAIEESWEGWAFGKLKNSRMYATDRILQQMPDFAFSDEDASALVVLLRSFTDETLPRNYVEIPSEERALRVAGQQLMTKHNCLGCHNVGGQGGTIAPDLAFEGSKVLGDWLLGFLKEPHMLRPILQARMPTFPLAEQEATTLRDYVMTAFVDTRIPKPSRVASMLTDEMARQGEKLYWEKHICLTCHQVQGKGAPAALGPDLTQAWKRLNPDWMVEWIKNPQAFDPKTIMPNLGLSDEDAIAIVAYLESLSRKMTAGVGPETRGSSSEGEQPSPTQGQ